MKRRIFLKNTAFAGITGMVYPGLPPLQMNSEPGELLYNGIQLPEIWPPRDMNLNAYDPMPVPYLCNPPQVIPIDVGRQLFVDDFLIESTNLKREYYRARKYEGNPVFKPETELEKGNRGQPVSCPKDGGVWWDPVENIFRMWYEAGWLGTMAYATSTDGITWRRPDLDVTAGTNQILPGLQPDSTTVFLDHETGNPNERFKMFLRGPSGSAHWRGYCMVSADGIHWSEPVLTGNCGDRSTMFFNPFRKKWVFSIRSLHSVLRYAGRARFYREHSDFLEGAAWKYEQKGTDEWECEEMVYWTGADRLDPPDPVIGQDAQLYNLSAAGYESILLGLHEIHLGPPNQECSEQGIPKITELKLSFSRDGFHWHRPDRKAFIPATRQPGDWDRGYVQSVGGICAVVGDQLWFYYTGFKGNQDDHHPDGIRKSMYANGSTGIAVLRRDGFASMFSDDYSGILTTRPVIFNGKYLFVNLDCVQGELKVEILDADHSVISPFSADNCDAVSGDSTIRQVRWKNEKDLSNLTGKKVRFRFHLTKGHLYSFWVSPDKNGSSRGYVASGGPGFKSSRDDVGTNGYQTSLPFKLNGIQDKNDG
jgi:hypothetical protein